MESVVIYLFGVFTLYQHAICARPEEINVNSLLRGFHSNQTLPKGPRNLNDKIAIVGGGPAGVHMAMLLKEKGFKRVTIFEKEQRVGGKSYTFYHRGSPHEMGTVYTQPDYTEIFRLVEKYDAGNLKTMPPAQAWIKIHNQTVIMSCGDAAGIELAKLKPDIPRENIKLHLKMAVGKYVQVHKSLFSDYVGEIMPRPSNAVLSMTNKTFLEFLIEHDVEALKALFVCTQTTQGYGHVDEIPALYGLLWMTPNFLINLLAPKPETEREIKILDKGFQFLWEEIVRQENLNVRLNSDVKRIIRRSSPWGQNKNKVTILYTENNCRIKRETFDFLILSPTMKSLSSKIQFKNEELYYFSKMNNDFFTTTLVDFDFPDVSLRSNYPQDYYFFNILAKEESSVWATRDSYAALNFIVKENYTKTSFPDGKDNGHFQSSVFYQYSKERPSKADLDCHLMNHFQNTLQTNLKQIVLRTTWPYFPKFSASDLTDGILWDILDMQGKYNTWYIGSSVCFESVKSVAEYNLLLLRTIPLPTK